MHDAGLGWDDAEIAERRLTPSQEYVTLPIAVVLEVGVQGKCVGRSEVIHLYRVIDDELHRLKGIDLFRVAAQGDHAVAHRREIYNAGDAGEVLQQNTS